MARECACSKGGFCTSDTGDEWSQWNANVARLAAEHGFGFINDPGGGGFYKGGFRLKDVCGEDCPRLVYEKLSKLFPQQ